MSSFNDFVYLFGQNLPVRKSYLKLRLHELLFFDRHSTIDSPVLSKVTCRAMFVFPDPLLPVEQRTTQIFLNLSSQLQIAANYQYSCGVLNNCCFLHSNPLIASGKATHARTNLLF